MLRIKSYLPVSFALSVSVLLSFILLIIFFLPVISSGSTGKERYIAADRCYKNLRHSPAKQKYRENWLKCIDKYQRVFTKDPSGAWAAAGMYRSAQIYLELHKKSFRKADRGEAIDLLKRVQKRYPSSVYSARARHLLKNISNEIKCIADKNNNKCTTVKKSIKPNPDLKPKPKSRHKTEQKLKHQTAPGLKTEQDLKHKTVTEQILGNDTYVTGLRFWSNPDYTRVVIDASKDSHFSHRLLKKDPSINQPQRLYVDLKNSRLGKNLPGLTAINDNLLLQARAGQHTPHSVRVVVDIKSFDNYKIFSLKDPFRLVIDVWGKKAKKQYHAKSPGKNHGENKSSRLSTDNIRSSAIAKQFALGVRRIVIDPGHGGKDPGAPGFFKGIWEKDIILQISKKLAERMRNRLKCDVLLTRSSDRYLTLEERTAIANTKNADLFISMHCNAARNKKLTGIETYYLNLATDDQAISVAARENATSRKNISDLESILTDLMQNAKINESSRLANIVQTSLCSNMKKKYSNINDLGVKQAPFYVLLGARMPSILIETSFLSNKRDCKRLVSSKYQTNICDSIIDGVEKYIKETNPEKL